MARLNKKQRRIKKWNNKALKLLKIKDDMDNIKREINVVQKSDNATEEDFSRIAKEVGKTITKGLLPKFKFVEEEGK